MMKQAIAPASAAGWQFWMGWMPAFLGFPLGGVVAAALVGPITTPLAGALGGVLAGAVVGTAQWLVLRRRLPLSFWWIAATALGMAAGLALGILLLGTGSEGAALPLRGLITGASIGVAQSLLLRKLSSRAPAWALIVALGWALGWVITRAVGVDLALNWAVFGSSGALTFQLLSGLLLRWVVNFERGAPAH